MNGMDGGMGAMRGQRFESTYQERSFFPKLPNDNEKKKKKDGRRFSFSANLFLLAFWSRFGRTHAGDERRTADTEKFGTECQCRCRSRKRQVPKTSSRIGRRTCLFDFVCLWLWFLDSVLLASYSLVARNPCNEKELWISLAAVFPVRFWVGKVCSFVRRRCRIFFLQQKRHVHTHTFTHACDNFETSSTLACRSPFSFSLLLNPLSFLRDLWQPPQMINERTNDDRCRCY